MLNARDIYGAEWIQFYDNAQVYDCAPSSKIMTPHDLGQLALLLSPAMLISVLLLFTFAAGG